MAETLQSFFAKVTEAATQLGEAGPLELVATIKEQINTPKLKILIVGSTGSGRFSLANLLLGQPDLLPVTPIPKKPLSVRVAAGDNGAVQVNTAIGSRIAVPNGKLRSFLTSAGSEEYTSIEVKSSSELLKTSELRLESIEAERAPGEWKEALASTDYAILVLRAVALLSEQERSFVREVLHPHLGLERVAIVINQIDLVEAEERPSMVERVRTFLGAFESQPLILEFSASQASKGVASGQMLPGSGYEDMMHLVKEELIEQFGTLKMASLRQAAQTCLDSVADEAQSQHTLLSASQSDLKGLLDKINSQEKWLGQRIERTQQRADTFINTLAKDPLLHAIEGFSDALRQQLPAEIAAVSDKNVIRKNLPGYFEALWSEFFTYQMGQVRTKLGDEMKLISTRIEDDLRELLGDKAADFEGWLVNFDATPANLRSFLMPRRSKSQTNTVVTGMQLGGFVLLAIGAWPLAAGAFGGGYLLKTAFNKQIDDADKQALLTSANAAIEELEHQLKRQVVQHFEELTVGVKKNIADLYLQPVEQAKVSLEENATRRVELEARREQITRLVDVTIPELRQQLDHLTGPVAA